MSKKFTSLSDKLYNYLASHSVGPDIVLIDLQKETERLGKLRMQISPDQGSFLTLITKLMGSKIAVEVGTFTGYSGICITRGLEENGRLITYEIDPSHANIAEKYFKKAGLDNKISIKMGPALELLKNLDQDNIDLVFIDADKVNYRNYYETLLPKVRQNGLIIFDNVLWHGAVISRWANDPDTKSIRELNDFLSQDSRVEVVMIPMADGMTLARKK